MEIRKESYMGELPAWVFMDLETVELKAANKQSFRSCEKGIWSINYNE